ncbi:tRNA 2-selenouridine(34) synthase MnmH [Desulfobotulus sp. H1]|uniref:tRNA 2-selenouridine(34) synthase MnmH n=1 Tax=Desulfobotulus pelophilus TaxID=2823377 RepID=A0ABT3NAI7_9BACT|nr:tRNA 2-selenouridine(34) synthase MnmH [Desulfobotulus pelophilus]MCW7754484.1 tRNA 2-selenouridine(34) synthase MnmH [Desulfobotulus pelophilus]
MGDDTEKQEQQAELNDLCQRIQAMELPEIRQNLIAPDVKNISQKAFGEVLQSYLCGDDPEYGVVDVRSESEYAKNAIPVAVSMPILNDRERHEVGLLYKRYSHKDALRYAFHLAREKEASYVEKARRYAGGRPLILYCWRGGGRSRYVAGLLGRHGVPVMRLEGGHKGFRREVYDLLYHGSLRLWSLSGMTGCGKSELLEFLAKTHPSLPVLHLEALAGHAASVFGHIRFAGQGGAVDQQTFETRLYLALLAHRQANGEFPFFLTEMESRKIGGVQIPPALFKALENGPHIRLESPMDLRVARLTREYFGEDGRGRDAVRDALLYLSRRVGGHRVRYWQSLLDKGDTGLFLHDILVDYYDKGYKGEKTEPFQVLCCHAIPAAAETVAGIWQRCFCQDSSGSAVMAEEPSL